MCQATALDRRYVWANLNTQGYAYYLMYLALMQCAAPAAARFKMMMMMHRKHWRSTNVSLENKWKDCSISGRSDVHSLEPRWFDNICKWEGKLSLLIHHRSFPGTLADFSAYSNDAGSYYNLGGT